MNGVPFQFTCDKCGDYLIATSRLYVCERCAVDTVEGTWCVGCVEMNKEVEG